MLGDMDEIRDIAARCFEYIYRWMPFISKKRLYEPHLQPTFSSQPSVALLLLSLKLFTTILPFGSRSPRSTLYYTVKLFHLEVEGSSDYRHSCVSIGCPGRPFATADPQLDDLLPAEDNAWDQGTVRYDDLFALSSPLAGHMSKFALLCQAARWLSQVLHHVSSEATTDNGAWLQLDRTLQSMLAAALDLDSPDHYQTAFVYSVQELSSNKSPTGSVPISWGANASRVAFATIV
ncbi:hypothetical protein N8T08_009799 [Aspergillus melleus]|uniref:Uncharacterized protein n=1 Tax=Aspergillus melleus TaxID=138277 RepID=A0ACC3ATU6_9EURO|nr:hypothetical protein N8T08_009799 [Aspergillus melleus]